MSTVDTDVDLERAAYQAHEDMWTEIARLDDLSDDYLSGSDPAAARAVIIAARYLTAPRHAITGTIDIIRPDDPTYQLRRAA